MVRLLSICLLGVVLLAGSAWAEPPGQGIWGYWPLSGDFKDYSPNQRDGAAHGKVADLAMQGPFAGAAHFSGGWVAVPGETGGGSFSVSAWVYYENGPLSFAPVVGRMGVTGSRMQLSYNVGPSAPVILSEVGLRWRRWSHVAVIWDEPGRTMSFWQRGARISTTMVPPEVTVLAPLGDALALGSAAFSGRLAEVLVYARALQADEVQFLSDGAGRQTPLQLAISTGCGGTAQGPCQVCRRYQAWPPAEWSDCAGGHTPWCAGNPNAGPDAVCP